MISRRSFLLSGFAAASSGSCKLLARSSQSLSGLSESLVQLEKDCNGRLGVAALDIVSGETSNHRGNERFAMCSTFKMLLASAVLQRVDVGTESLGRMIPIPANGTLPSSPITQNHTGGKITVGALCAAIVTRSDNTAANLLLDTVGGPNGITRFARSLGDMVTQLDRVEMALNEALPGDPRDTTSPLAMVANWHKLLLGDELSPSSRKQLTEWLIANRTGDERLRAGLTSGWIVGDKTGSNGENTTNDVAIVWPANKKPLLIAAYLTACPGPETKRNAVLASVGRLVAKSIQSA
jgi:beta-lactamase class A